MKVLIPLAEGVEEMEAVIVTDVLRRAEWEVVTAGLAAGPLTASRGVRLLPDALWADVCNRPFDMLVIPGGLEGVKRLHQEPTVMDTIRAYARPDRWLAAICAGPLLLDAAGVLDGRSLTAHPSVVSALKTGTVLEQPVVRDGNLITSRGPGTALRFALTLVACQDVECAQALATAMVFEF